MNLASETEARLAPSRGRPGRFAPAGTVAMIPAISHYNANHSAYNTTVFINTPITTDGSGDIFFGSWKGPATSAAGNWCP